MAGDGFHVIPGPEPIEAELAVVFKRRFRLAHGAGSEFSRWVVDSEAGHECGSESPEAVVPASLQGQRGRWRSWLENLRHHRRRSLAPVES